MTSRKTPLAPHLSSAELKQRYRTAPDPVESRRWHLLWKISLGWTVRNSAIAVGLTYSYAYRIVSQYNELGAEGLKNKRKEKREHPRGKKALLNPEQLKKLSKALEEKPADGGIWTGPKVARWIEKELGIEKVWNQRGWDYLKKCRYSCQSPRPKHHKGDKEEQQEFKENLPKKIEKLRQENPKAKLEVWFFDEHRVGLKPIVRKVWSPIGKRPTAPVHHRYEWLYVYGFVEPKSGKTCWYLIPRVNTQWLNLVFKAFAAQQGASEEQIILVVEDNAGWHRSQKVELPPGIMTEFLPPYSPELQPAERLWLLVDEPLVNQYFETLEQIEEVLVNRCQTLTQMTHEIKQLTDYHWLKYDTQSSVS